MSDRLPALTGGIFRRMRRFGWSARILLRYTLFQIPSLVLLAIILWAVRPLVELSEGCFWGVLVLWVAKDALLFPFVWRAYDRSQERSSQKMIGQKGVAKERLDPSGYIFIRGELWKAEVIEGSPPVEEGETVRVEGTRGRILLVRREESEAKR